MAVYDPRGGGNIHLDVALTNLSIGFPNGDFVGPALLPAVPVKKQSDKYYVFGYEGWGLDPGGDLRAPGTVANEIPGMKVSTDTYFAQEHALQIAVTDEERENADSPFAPDRDGAELVTNKVWLQREVAIKTLVTTAANYATGNSVTLSGTAQFNDYTNSNPIGIIKTAIRAIHAKLFVRPNTAIIPWEVMSILEDHPAFIERIKYSERGIVTEEIIASMIGVSNIIVAGAGQNVSNPGQAVSLGYLWGKDIILAYVPPRASLRTPAFGYEFVWSYGQNRPQMVDRWREEPRKSDIIRLSRRYDLKLAALDGSGKATAGYLIKNAVA